MENSSAQFLRVCLAAEDWNPKNVEVSIFDILSTWDSTIQDNHRETSREALSLLLPSK